jgi:hypothetical protein
MRTATRPTTLLTAAVLAGCLTSAGCIPGLTWTPDSRGFYFTGGDNYQKLLYFDVAARKARTVVADIGGMTQWPAVSPDGKHIAVAVSVERDGQRLIQVVVYDAQGKEVRRTRPAALGRAAKGKPDKKDQNQGPVWLFWGPKDQADKVLLQAGNGCALVDLKEDRFTDLGNHVLWIFGHSPVRPDGRGFLTVRPEPRKGDKGLAAAFQDWQGKPQAINLPDLTALKGAAFPYAFASRWQGAVATARERGAELAVDTGKQTAGLTEVKPPRTAESQVIRQEYRFGKDGVRVRVVELSDDPKMESPLRIEILPPGKPRRVLDEKASLSVLLPSPDGKTLAVRYLVGTAGQNITDRVVVIDARGEVLADINAMKE